MPEDVQPQEGQGADGGQGVFDSYLQSVPEEARDSVASYLKDAEKNVNSRLEEAAQIQKDLGPYRQVEGLEQYDPNQLSELLAWHQQVTSSDEAFKEWVEATSREVGITPQEQEGLEGAEERGELSREEVQQLINQAAEERLAPIQEQFQNFEAEKAIDFESDVISTELDRLAKENKLDLTGDQRAMILDLGMPFAYDNKGNDLPLGDTSWVAAGFDRFREIFGQGQKAFVNQANQAPPPAMSTGGTAALEATTDWSEATKMARERFAQMRSS